MAIYSDTKNYVKTNLENKSNYLIQIVNKIKQYITYVEDSTSQIIGSSLWLKMNDKSSDIKDSCNTLGYRIQKFNLDVSKSIMQNTNLK